MEEKFIFQILNFFKFAKILSPGGIKQKLQWRKHLSKETQWKKTLTLTNLK